MCRYKHPKNNPYPALPKPIQRKPYCSPEKPYIRNLKVYYMFRSTNFFKPVISLTGKWLEDAGFSIGDEIRVTVNDNRLIIESVK